MKRFVLSTIALALVAAFFLTRPLPAQAGDSNDPMKQYLCQKCQENLDLARRQANETTNAAARAYWQQVIAKGCDDKCR